MPDFPSRLLFRPIAACPRIRPAPRIDGDLGDWAAVPPLPPLAEYDAEAVFADICVAWDESGLYIAERCERPSGVVAVNRRRPHAGDGLQVFIDTRATQGTHRATRFCHHFVLLPRSGGGTRSEPVGWQAPIMRARERAPLCAPQDIEIASSIHEGFYVIEAHLPARILNGFEPRPGARIGFNYHVHDVVGGRRLWSSPRGFPADRDPSLWGILELGE
jgi:hypothetical protein